MEISTEKAYELRKTLDRCEEIVIDLNAKALIGAGISDEYDILLSLLRRSKWYMRED